MSAPERSAGAAASDMRGSLWAYLRPHLGRLALGVCCLLLTNVGAQAIPWVIKHAIDAVGAGAGPDRVGRLALLLCALAVAGGVIRVLSRVLIFNVGRQVEYELRNDLFEQLLALPPSFYRRHPTGDLMSTLTNDLGAVRGVVGPGVLYVANTAFAYALAVPLMVRIDPLLTVMSVAPYPLLYLMARRFARLIYAHSRVVQDELAALSSTLQEDLAGVQVVKGYAIEPRREAAFAAAADRYLDRAMRLARLRGVITPAMSLVGGLAMLVALVAGGRMAIAGRITLGDLVAFNLYLAILAWPTMAIGWILALWQRGLASWSRLARILAEVPAIADPPGAADDGGVLGGAIELRELTVTLDDRPVLDRVSLRVPAGAVCAVVGRVGSGKSTLVEALPRLIEVPPGTVFVGGRDVTTVPLAKLRRSIAYAPQEAFLFSTTIGRNIELGARGPADGVAAAKASAAGLDPDLAGLPDGLATTVGERGITLSGGQRQRTALARALAAEAPVLILDDSLSSVDAETERAILTRLRGEFAGRTVLVVSHRVSALRDADQIVVLDGGRVAEQGRHEELLARGGVYAELYTRQTIERELEELEAG